MDALAKSTCFDFIKDQGSECSSTQVSETEEILTSDDIEDASKLAAFFGMTDQTFMHQLLNPDSTLSTCVDFLYEAKAEKFKAFKNIYKICHVIEDDVYGSHFLIASKGPNEYRVMTNMNRNKNKKWDRDILEVALKGCGSHIKLGRKQVNKEPTKSDQQTFTMAFSMVAHYSSWLVRYLDEQMVAFNAEHGEHSTEIRENVVIAIDHLRKEIHGISLTDFTKEKLTQKLIWLDYFLYRYLLDVRHAVKHQSESQIFMEFLENHINKHSHKSTDKMHGYIQGNEKLILMPDNTEPQLQVGNMKYDVKIHMSNTKSSPLKTVSVGSTLNYITGFLYDLITSILPILIETPTIKDSTTKGSNWSFVTTEDSVYLQPCLCSMDRKVSCFQMDNLIPHYSKEARSCLIDEMYDPVPDYKVIAADDLRDGVKLAQFFNVTHEYLLQSFMFPDNCEIDNCMKFIEESRSLGYKTFVNCVVFCGKTADNDVLCGSHVFIALKPDQEDVFLQILEKHKTDIEPRHELPAEATLRTFPNFKGVLESPYPKFVEYFFKASQFNSQQHLLLGERGKTEISTNPTLDSSNAECFLVGRQLLDFLTERLNTAFETTELENQIDGIQFVIAGGSIKEIQSSSAACKGSVVVNGVVEKLPPLLTNLTETTNPLEIKEVETLVAKLLTIVMHYCYFSKEPEVFRKVLAGILSKVEELDFKMDSDLWCIANGVNVAKIGSPVIRVRRSKVEAFKAAIGEQKAGLFPIVVVPDADNEADYMLDFGKPGESSVLKFAHGSAGPIEDAKFTIPYCGPCLCNPRETPSRICKTCQMVLFLTTRGDIRCACTVYDRNEFKCSETCEKPLSTLIESANNDHELVEDGFELIDHSPLPKPNGENTDNFSEKPIYTVVVAGSTGAGKSTLLNSIYCMQQNGTFDNALGRKEQTFLLPVRIEETINGELRVFEYGENTNEEFAVGKSTTQRPKDYIIDYGNFKVRFVDTPGTNDTRGDEQDRTNVKYIQDHLTGLDEVHGILFVIKTDDSKLSPDFRRTMNMLLELLPRKALNNCCFVYTFSAITSHFTPGPARQAVQAFFNEFCEKHRLPELQLTDSNQYCVDNEAFRNIVVHHQGGGLNDAEKYKTIWDKTAINVGRLLEHIKSIDPVTQNEFKSVKLLNELGDIMRQKLKTQPATDQTKHIMATVSDICLSGNAIFCRQKSETSESITTEAMINVAIENWSSDGIVFELLQNLRQTLFKIDIV
uniref:G domain-containing protein n=1 Tax=Panagrellus redivivus TaxID=6233 RepID=A0A7E4WCC7_PANRE